MQFRLQEYDTIPTTNGVIKDAIRTGEPEGLVVSAFKQTSGYGRQGRDWVSPYGGLYASFLLRPNVAQEQLSTIALVAALAVRDAILAALASVGVHASREINVKWPNDVLCAQGKLSGISSEFVHGALCIGIGVNVFEPYEHMCVTGKNTPAYVAQLISSDKQVFGCLQEDSLSAQERTFICSVRAALIASFQERYSQWAAQGFAACAEDFRDCMTLLGSQIEVVKLDGTPLAQGKVVGVNNDGLLLVQDAAGATIGVASGEAHILSID